MRGKLLVFIQIVIYTHYIVKSVLKGNLKMLFNSAKRILELGIEEKATTLTVLTLTSSRIISEALKFSIPVRVTKTEFTSSVISNDTSG